MKTRNIMSLVKKNGNGINLALEEKLWATADKMRGHMDAAEYKHVVLGLIFLKYISDVFETYHCKLQKEEVDAEDFHNYQKANIFWVPKKARWSYLKLNRQASAIGELVDRAMMLLEEENPALKNALPKDFS